MARKRTGRASGHPADSWERHQRIFEEVQVLRFAHDISLTEAARRYAKRAGRSLNHTLLAVSNIDRHGETLLNDALDRVEKRVFGICDGRLGRWEPHPITLPSSSGTEAACAVRCGVVPASPELEALLVELLGRPVANAA